MTDIPDQIVLKRHRDLASAGFNRPVRYVLLVLVGAFLVLGLFNVFGQRPETQFLDTAKAKIELYAPAHLRGGLLYEARITVAAHEDVKDLLVQLSPGWNEGMQQNTLEPSPLSEASRNGDLFLDFGHIAAGTTFRAFMQFQTNPTNIGHRRADVSFYDGKVKLGTIRRAVTVFP